MPVQISDVIVPAEFTPYIVENSLVSTALFRSGVAVRNGVMDAQLQAGADSFTVPVWNDLADTEANIGSDDPTAVATPLKVGAYSMAVRKSFVNQSWSEMNLASELSGSDALRRIQDRVSAYWDRQMEFRLYSSLLGILYSNVANNSSDMVVDISAATTGSPVVIGGTSFTSPSFGRNAVIEAVATLGDRMEDVKAIAMHSFVYKEAQKNNEIEFIRDSDNNLLFATYAGMAVLVDDNLTTSASGVYVSILFGEGAVGFALAPPRTGYGTEIWRQPGAGNGSGLTELHSRLNMTIHPLGFSWNDGTGENALALGSPLISDLKNAAHWTRATSQRKAVPLAFLITK